MATLRPPFSDYIRYMAAQHLSANQHFINLFATDSLRPVLEFKLLQCRLTSLQFQQIQVK